MASEQEPPFVDEHVHGVWITEAVTRRDRVARVQRGRVVGTERGRDATLGIAGVALTVPRSGFEVIATDPPCEVVLGGRHRFSTYRLVFRVEPDDDRSRLSALTYAAFPGLHGRAYRTGLMLSTGHRRATQHMLRTVARGAER